MDIPCEKGKTSNLKNRLIGHIQGYAQGPIVLFFAAIHGNEPAGVIALQKIFIELEHRKAEIKGDIYGIIGNLNALNAGQRFIDEDLNRIWTKNRIDQLDKKANLLDEETEMQNVWNLIQDILQNANGPVYFIDFHTTSSKTSPFITINDSLNNRKFALQYPVPIILGIEEYLDGTMLNYINQKGYVAIGFEGGQNQEEKSIAHFEAFIYLTLNFAGLIKKLSFPFFDQYYDFLDNSTGSLRKVFEIVYLHKINVWDRFMMYGGFESFQVIRQGMDLAIHNDQIVKAPYAGRIFMPLYQSQGNDGFFIIQKIPFFALNLSSFLRKLKVDNLLTLLPGVRWEVRDKMILKVNSRTARFLTKPFFHLLGYRVRLQEGDYLKLSNRERVAKKKMYRKEKWY
ncbi:succinylglutamate desuccinylase/aspartoacylase family protein [Cecembia rubra]|uniref:Succinylglutamate desuccinylase/aspartoacylase family protein n=1 Tax=Cecembia rubra TaxID=1485585 RepID=A0A2P8ED54_9BACT|nr:succinylglutamate desuccinylase/aspartoacylase family protein [Cecembia rubra]PSL07390.1 succinylglutamate desuccinylase/aspartoacylase family protein [Cecembia rubra]